MFVTEKIGEMCYVSVRYMVILKQAESGLFPLLFWRTEGGRERREKDEIWHQKK